MTEPTHNPQPEAPLAVTPRRLEQIASGYGPQVRIGLFLLAACFAAYPAYAFIRFRGDAPLAAWWLTVLALVTFAVAVLNVAYTPGALTGSRMSEGERLRFIAVLLGGLLGICTAAYGFLLPFTEYQSVFAGGFEEWRKNRGAIGLTLLPFFGGLILSFLSLMLTAGLERSSATARRLLYGYNAVLSGLLLLFILLLVNVLPYSGVWPFKALAQTSDWTSTGLYSLSQATKERLAKLDQPVKVYVILSSQDGIGNEVDTMFQNLREYTNRITVDTLSPDINFKQVDALVGKYQLTDPRGLLIVYGTDPDTSYEFIPRKDLYTDTSTEETRRFAFKGEAAFTKALTYLSEGKTKPIVYFTQGHGELDFSDRVADRPDKGIGVAADLLAQASYETKPLPFESQEPKVPDDADIVVVARPRLEFSPAATAALRNFATGGGKKKGKLFILLDVVPTRDGKMAKTGLEPMLNEFGVQVGNDRLLALSNQLGPNPLELIAYTNPKGDNPIARAFYPKNSGRPVGFSMTDARTVSPAPPNPGAPPRYTAEVLMVAMLDLGLITESDLNADPATVVARLRAELRKDAESRNKVLAKVLNTETSVAVTVSETKGQAPPIPGHEFMGGESQPRMVVFGDASWVCNSEVSGRDGRFNYDLFSSCINWLRERPDIGAQAVADKTRSEFQLPKDVGGLRLLLLPVTLILLTVICLGTGVWVVRRR
jgi:hypothetical protein